MYLELHDNEEGNTLTAKVNNIDYDYQAEQWVLETHDDLTAADVIKWILYDDQGVRCVWERPVGSGELPDITQRSGRFVGEWEKGSTEVAI
ncbi:hypothetical protein HOB10_01980 [Candidatus Parcubacteria bacterium]|jgi:hypothetical protein|nr:hypothetical protein [Candidatus Parcubacteria bacterium]